MIKLNIKIELENINDALNKYNKEELNEEMNEYILSCCETKFFKTKKITLEIKGINKSEELSNIIHNFYKKKLTYLKKVDKIDDYFRLGLLLIGLIAIILSEYLPSFISELFLIAGWVVIWEIVYDIIFIEIKKKRKANIYKELSKCIIEFI